MAGHSKWSNIKYKKKNNDLKKEKNITKLLSKISNKCKTEVSFSKDDFFLKKIYNKAADLNINKALVDKLIFKNDVKIDYNSILNYSAYIKGGVALYITCFNCNKNRIISELRYLLSKYDGFLVKTDSVLHLFEKFYRIRVFTINNSIIKKVQDFCIKDYLLCEFYFEITIKCDDFINIKNILSELNLKYCFVYFLFPYEYIKLDII